MAHRFRPNRQESRALDAFVKLMRATDSLWVLLNKALAGTGLSHSQLGVLEALLHLGPMNQRTLAGKILRSSSNMSTLIDSLEDRGWVKRQRDSADRRAYVVCLTPSGRRLMEDIFPAHARRITQALSVLGDREQEELARLCKKLGRSLNGPHELETMSSRVQKKIGGTHVRE